MANRPKCHLTQNLFLLLSYTAVVVASSALPQPQTYYSQHYSPSNYPQPHDFPSERLYQAYLVIQRFKKTITCDPKNITSTWAGNDICGDKTYSGFYCATLPRHGNNLTVASVVLNDFGLCAPKLQGFIDELPDLALFQASSNKFGAFDVVFNNPAGLAYRYKLDVSDNQLAHTLQRNTPLQRTGDFPWNDEKDSLPSKTIIVSADFCLRVVNKPLCANLGIGSSESLVAVPGATNARTLLLNNDNLSGPLPANLGFSKLSYLALANNKLTGPIPPSISHLQDSLFEVLLLNNQLSGCLPAELGTLHKATVIDAGMNQLTGPIPSSFSCLTSVEQLNLGGNRLYGHVPDALCNLAAGPAGRLANLTLSGNYFTSVGPACAALIRDGVLDVKNNCIPGLADQRRPAECAAFQSQPKSSCPAAATAQVACPAAAAVVEDAAAATGERKAREYSSYVTYATLHE